MDLATIRPCMLTKAISVIQCMEPPLKTGMVAQIQTVMDGQTQGMLACTTQTFIRSVKVNVSSLHPVLEIREKMKEILN